MLTKITWGLIQLPSRCLIINNHEMFYVHFIWYGHHTNTLTQWTDWMLCFGGSSIRASFCHQSIGGFSKNTGQTTIWEEMPRETVPEKEVFLQEVVGANVSQRKPRVDGQEQSAVDGHQLQTLQARRHAGQHLWVRLPQPISVRLESKEGAFGEDGGMRQRSVQKTAIDQKNGTIEDGGQIS